MENPIFSPSQIAVSVGSAVITGGDLMRRIAESDRVELHGLVTMQRKEAPLRDGETPVMNSVAVVAPEYGEAFVTFM